MLSGRERPFGGRLVVGGLLLPEQREAVHRAATLIDLAGRGHRTDAPEQARARLVSFSPAGAARSCSACRSSRTGSGLRCGRTERPCRSPCEPLSSRRSMALASDVQVAVLVGLDDLPPGERGQAERLADALADDGLAVLLLTGEPESSVAQVLVGDAAGAAYGNSGGGTVHE